MRRAILTIAAAAALLLTAAPPASAGETRCVGTLGPGTVDNLLVPSGGTCRLFGTQVRGNVRVEADARFDASSADIAGNVDCERAPANSSQCRLRNRTRVGGSIKLLEGVTSSTSDGVRIDGDVTCDRCRRSDLGSGTEVGGDVQVKEATEGSVNTGGSPGAARLSVGGDVELLASRGGLTLFNTDVRATSRSRATPASWWWATPASQTSSAGTSRSSRTTFSFARAERNTVGGDFQLFGNQGPSTSWQTTSATCSARRTHRLRRVLGTPRRRRRISAPRCERRARGGAKRSHGHVRSDALALAAISLLRMVRLSCGHPSGERPVARTRDDDLAGA